MPGVVLGCIIYKQANSYAQGKVLTTVKATARGGRSARQAENEPVQQRHYANRAGWLVVGEWCTRRVAFADLGRKLSIARSRAEGAFSR